MAQHPPDQQLEMDRELDRVLHRFDQALRQGEAVRIEDFLADGQSIDPRLLKELLWTEIEFRKSKREVIDWIGYIARFPQVGDALLAAQAADRSAVSSETSQQLSQESVVVVTDPQGIASEPLAPLDLSDYILKERLGRGGQGEVHLAEQRSLGRKVAIKVLNSASGDPLAVQRFLREARSLAQTQHPHIVTIHGIGRTPAGELFLVMEFVGGDDLSKQISTKKFGIDEAVRIVVQISRAIDHAHGCGIIHRDLKPSNVLWDAVRGPVVTDFGLAKDLRAVNPLTVSEQMMGTPSYMAPEQADRKFGEITEQTDVYGLAAVLFALLTGQPPFGPGPLLQVLQQVTSLNPAPDVRSMRPEVPESLDLICRRGLAKQPAERCGSVKEFTSALEQWLTGECPTDLFVKPAPPTDVTPPATTVRLEPGAQFGPYRLMTSLSTDHTRKVFLAEDSEGRSILLKCLPEEWLADRLKRSQFRQEVLLSSGLNHPCLAKVVNAGVLARTEFLALEYFSGTSVAQKLAQDGPCSESQAVNILQPISEALHLIHGAGVIYRDLRPQNILLVEDSRPMLAEVRFSEELAVNDNMTLSGWGDVTSKYIAPELLTGKSSDVASDVYTLGATLYAMLTGQEPFADARDAIALMIQKNAGQLTPPRKLVPELSDDICKLLTDSLAANPSLRPASAAEFARRLSDCTRQNVPPPEKKIDLVEQLEQFPPAAGENLLHTVWDRLDPELQDAFSLAYNKKRRTGSTRISTRDLFEALGRLGSGPVRQMMDALPPGALPKPADEAIPLDRTVLKEQPLLSDCVQGSLMEFQKLDTDAGMLAPVDLFVDVAKHGHGESVVQLRKHGVNPDLIEGLVQKLGLNVIRRRTESAASDEADSQDEKYLSHDNVQFSVYRPRTIRPETWEPLLAFAHLSELPADAPAGTPDPIAEVRRQAEQVLGVKSAAYQSLTSDSTQPIPHSAELTFVPSGDGLEFNPPQRTFRWLEPVHREEFRFRAAERLNGQLARGRLSVYLGRLLIAEVSIVARVDRNVATQPIQALSSENRAYRFRRIYACVSRTDRAVVSEFQRYAQLLHDTFLTSQLRDHPKPRSPQEQQHLIASADVFQLYWSNSAMDSPEMEREWRYALSLRRPEFIKPLYWEEPFPTRPERSLPPPELLALGFHKIPSGTCAPGPSEDRLASLAMIAALPSKIEKQSSHQKLGRVRSARVEDDSPASTAYLEILSGPQQGKILRLAKDRITIGRHTEADLVLDASSISRYHSQFIRENDHWSVEDLQTRNGTFVNGMKCAGRVLLHDGDQIQVGNVILGFRSAGLPNDAVQQSPATDVDECFDREAPEPPPLLSADTAFRSAPLPNDPFEGRPAPQQPPESPPRIVPQAGSPSSLPAISDILREFSSRHGHDGERSLLSPRQASLSNTRSDDADHRASRQKNGDEDRHSRSAPMGNRSTAARWIFTAFLAVFLLAVLLFVCMLLWMAYSA